MTAHRRLIWTLALLVAACSSGVPGVPPIVPTAVVAQADLPPVGAMWFGSSFDVGTFALSGRTTTIKFGNQVAFIAHLTRPSQGEVVGLALDIGGLAATWPGGQLAPGDEVMGQVLPAAEIYQPGPLVVRVVDAGGNTLAQGTVTITP